MKSAPGADGYQIYREVGVTVDVKPRGGRGPPRGLVEQPDAAVVRVKIALLFQEERFFFGVATVKDRIESELAWPTQNRRPSHHQEPGFAAVGDADRIRRRRLRPPGRGGQNERQRQQTKWT